MSRGLSQGARGHRLGGAVLCALAATALGAPAAHAGTSGPTVPLGSAHGLDYFKAQMTDVDTPAGPTASCGNGDLVTGGGGSISGPPDAARLTSTRPSDPTLDGWTAEGARREGDLKTVSAFAICGPTPGSYVQDSTAFGGGASGDDATCSAGNLTGGGASQEGTDFLYYQMFAQTPTSWRVDALHTSTATETMTLYAVCSSVLDLSYRSSDRARVPAGTAGKARAKCGRRQAVTGGGFETKPVPGPWPVSTRPWDGPDGNATPDDGWTARIYNDAQSGVRLFAHAICKR